MTGQTYVITEDLGSLLKEGMVIYIYGECEKYYHIQVTRHYEKYENDFFTNFKVSKELGKYFHPLGTR